MHAQILFSFSTLDAPGAFHDLELVRGNILCFLETLESQKGLMKTRFWYKESPKLGRCRRAHLTCVWRCVGRWEGVFRLNDVIVWKDPLRKFRLPFWTFCWFSCEESWNKSFKHFLDVFSPFSPLKSTVTKVQKLQAAPSPSLSPSLSACRRVHAPKKNQRMMENDFPGDVVNEDDTLNHWVTSWYLISVDSCIHLLTFFCNEGRRLGLQLSELKLWKAVTLWHHVWSQIHMVMDSVAVTSSDDWNTMIDWIFSYTAFSIAFLYMNWLGI